jgi:hypothetical protein
MSLPADLSGIPPAALALPIEVAGTDAQMPALEAAVAIDAAMAAWLLH